MGGGTPIFVLLGHCELIPVGPQPQLVTGLVRLRLESLPHLFLQLVLPERLLCGCWGLGSGRAPSHTSVSAVHGQYAGETRTRAVRNGMRNRQGGWRNCPEWGCSRKDLRGRAAMQGPWGGHASAAGAEQGSGRQRQQRAWGPWQGSGLHPKRRIWSRQAV